MTISKLFISWLIIVFLMTFTCSLTYLVTQQSLRLGANELSAQLVAGAASDLNQGKGTESSISDASFLKSMGLFVKIYDKDKQMLGSFGSADQNATYPKRILSYVDQRGEDRVTWQTTAGQRFATIVIKYDRGYAVAGRSLQETEKLIDDIGRLILSVWIVCIVCLTIGLAVIGLFMKKFTGLRKAAD